jgi:hypothetical protein
MKNLLIILAGALVFFQCAPKKQVVSFQNLTADEFNAGSLSIQGGKTTDSIRHAHDSCMGFSFDANVFLAGSRDSIFAGTILNKRSLKTIGSLGDVGFDFQKMANQYVVVSNPCYEKRELHFPLKLIFPQGYTIELPGVDAAVNKELNEIIAASRDEEVQSGSWIYVDMKEVIKNIMDTAKTAAGLQYKAQLLDTSNMVLSAVESIMRISFKVQSNNIMSEALRTKLSAKPTITVPGLRYPLQLYLIGPNEFQISTDGFFPMVGKFMKVQLVTN